jgi:hypothetical protein
VVQAKCSRKVTNAEQNRSKIDILVQKEKMHRSFYEKKKAIVALRRADILSFRHGDGSIVRLRFLLGFFG